jgi:hypothetical protein
MGIACGILRELLVKRVNSFEFYKVKLIGVSIVN